MQERQENLLRVARESYGRRDYAAAELALRQVLELHGDYPDVHNMLGNILHSHGDLFGATKHFERAVELNPRYTEALLNLAITLADSGEYEAARGTYDRLRAGHTGTMTDPFVRGKIANQHADLAKSYVDAGCVPAAISELQRAIDLCPDFPDLHTRLATLYRDQGNHALAREHLTCAISTNPRYAPAHVLLGLTMLSLGAPDRAVASFRTALTVDPGNKSARMHLRRIEDDRNSRSSQRMNAVTNT
ncbi:MAG TPA: tetratricopeptide repeat protein [Polyangium sp.]|nr:tetratricopeptide repeat protein [Polyangium sp.]